MIEWIDFKKEKPKIVEYYKNKEHGYCLGISEEVLVYTKATNTLFHDIYLSKFGIFTYNETGFFISLNVKDRDLVTHWAVFNKPKLNFRNQGENNKLLKR